MRNALKVFTFLCVTLFLFVGEGHTQQKTNVDTRLVLVVDQSSSMVDKRWTWQLEGYANALSNPQILDSISNGPFGQIAIAVVRYSTMADVGMDWTIYNRETAEGISNNIRNLERSNRRSTSIGRGLLKAMELLDENDYNSIHDVIIVSGDGDNNTGIDPYPLSHEIAEFKKVTIIGGAIIFTRGSTVRDPLEFYEDRVIAGVGAFAQHTNSAQEFVELMERLFVYEGRLR